MERDGTGWSGRTSGRHKAVTDGLMAVVHLAIRHALEPPGSPRPRLFDLLLWRKPSRSTIFSNCTILQLYIRILPTCQTFTHICSPTSASTWLSGDQCNNKFFYSNLFHISFFSSDLIPEPLPLTLDLCPFINSVLECWIDPWPVNCDLWRMTFDPWSRASDPSPLTSDLIDPWYLTFHHFPLTCDYLPLISELLSLIIDLWPLTLWPWKDSYWLLAYDSPVTSDIRPTNSGHWYFTFDLRPYWPLVPDPLSPTVDLWHFTLWPWNDSFWIPVYYLSLNDGLTIHL